MPYHQFTNEAGEAYGSFEVFHLDWQYTNNKKKVIPALMPLKPGWYWRPRFPGCLPDGDPRGPFDTEEAAIADAKGE